MSENDLIERCEEGSLEQAMVLAKRHFHQQDLVTDALLARKSAAVCYVVLSG